MLVSTLMPVLEGRGDLGLLLGQGVDLLVERIHQGLQLLPLGVVGGALAFKEAASERGVECEQTHACAPPFISGHDCHLAGRRGRATQPRQLPVASNRINDGHIRPSPMVPHAMGVASRARSVCTAARRCP